MQAGKLDKKLIILQKTYTVNSIGERVVSTSVYKTVYGSIEWNPSRRLTEAQKDSILAAIKATIRYIPNFSTDYVITIDNTNYEIISYIEVDRQRYMELILVAKKNG